MMTAHATVESAIEAMKLGALDYLQKPFEIDEFLVVVGRAIEHGRLRTHHDYLITERDEQFDHYGIVGRSRAIQEVVRTAKIVAQSRSTVLITGETGTGKELVARAIHDWSAQRDMPLVRVNCAALPETLIESELFGHVRGAFTGAVDEQEGPVRAGRRRDDLPRRDWRHRAVRAGQAAARAAGARVRAARVRAHGRASTCASSRRPIATCAQLVGDGRFQEDLYYRLNVIPIAMPPLRDRREDIPLLVEHFIRRHAGARRQADRRHHARGDGGCWPMAPWPGNVRELENTIERAVVLAPQPVIQARDVVLVGR